jgi:hypothetical protein
VCLASHDGVTNITGTAGPKDGDVSICSACAAVNIFDSTAEGRMRRPTQSEQRKIDRDPKLRVAVMAMLFALNNQPRKKGTS